MEMICRKVTGAHPARAAGYVVKFTFDGRYEVRKDDRLIKGGFLSEDAAWHWADEYVRLGDG